MNAEKDEILVVSREKIAALKWQNGEWSEFCEKIEGVGFASTIYQPSPNSAWLELGVNHVAHVSILDGAIKLEDYNDFDWQPDGSTSEELAKRPSSPPRKAVIRSMMKRNRSL